MKIFLWDSSHFAEGDRQCSAKMTYLSPYVHYIICKIAEQSNDNFLEDKSRGTPIDDLTIFCKFSDDENAKKRKFYFLNAKEIWKKAHLSGSDYKESNKAVQYINWTGSADLILECMNLAIESTSLGILKLTVIIERALGDVFVTIENERCPSLLKDLLQMEALRKLFGETLMTDLETLMGPPISLNLRNVLWHGFPMLGEIQPRYCRILLDQIIALGMVLEEKQIVNIKHRSKLPMPNTDPIEGCFPFINSKEIVFKLFKSTAFIPTGMAPAWKLSVEFYLSGRYADAVILFLPQLEHALRCLFAVVNRCPNRQITAESDVLYTTFDEILAKDIALNTPNLLLPEVGSRICEMLYDLLYFPEGLRLRDRLSHGEYHFDHVNNLIANHVLCIGLCLCLKYLFPWRQHLKTEWELLAKLARAFESYRSLYHPVYILMREISVALERTEALIGGIESVEVVCKIETENTTDLITVFHRILTKIFSLATHCTNMNGIGNFDYQSVVMVIRKLITVKRDVMHRPKLEIEVNGILRKIAKQVGIAADQVLWSVKEKRMQFETRKLRSRARNNYLSMLKVLPVLTTCWLTLLLIGSIEGLLFDDANSYIVIKYLKKCLKYSENIATLSSPSNNKWLECLGVAEKLSQVLRDRLQLIETDNHIL